MKFIRTKKMQHVKENSETGFTSFCSKVNPVKKIKFDPIIFAAVAEIWKMTIVLEIDPIEWM
jgi:hypothetical protein